MTWHNDGDLEILMLGQIEVGRILHSGGRANKPRYLFHLGNRCPFWKTEKTLDIARSALLNEVDDFLKRAGLVVAA